MAGSNGRIRTENFIERMALLLSGRKRAAGLGISMESYTANRQAMDGPLGKSWYLKGKQHREDGPAVEWADGRKEWYRHGQELTEAEFAALREKELDAIGDAFKKGLDHKVTVKTIGKLKTSSEARKSARDTGRAK